MKRTFPFPPYPNGWFGVGYSDEVAVGQVVPLSYFGRELVAFRGSDGKVSVLDACCLFVWNVLRALFRHCFVTDVKAPASGTCSAKLDSATKATAATAKRRVILVFLPCP